MEHEFNSIHKLPVVNFNRCGNSLLRTSSYKKTSPQHENTYKNTKEKQTHRRNPLVGKFPNCVKIKSTYPIVMKKRSRSLTNVTLTTNGSSKSSFCGK